MARHFQQPETRYASYLNPRAIVVHGITQPGFDLALILVLHHIDKIDDDQAAKVANFQLARNFVGSFEVGHFRGIFNIAAAGGARGVDVDRGQGLGMIDNDCAARGQVNFA